MCFTFVAGKSGVLLSIRVKPRAKTNSIIGIRGERILISVTAAPEKGAANAAVLAVLAKILAVAPGELSVVRGHKSREKTICIASLSGEEIQKRLTAALPSD
jgi:uncharacterized protein (TIGR00251 family)